MPFVEDLNAEVGQLGNEDSTDNIGWKLQAGRSETFDHSTTPLVVRLEQADGETQLPLERWD